MFTQMDQIALWHEANTTTYNNNNTIMSVQCVTGSGPQMYSIYAVHVTSNKY